MNTCECHVATRNKILFNYSFSFWLRNTLIAHTSI